MDQQRFDALTRAISRRFSRRAVIRQGGAGLIGTAAAVTGQHVAAQESPPASTPGAGNTAPQFLYVQTFGAGTMESQPDRPDHFLLTLTDAPALTIAFADHPSRQTNTLPTERLPDALAFDAANPPNAALVTRLEGGEEVVVVVELLEPTYDAVSRTVTYVALELAEYGSYGGDLTGRAQPLASLPDSFGSTSLFIDSGGDGCLPFAEDCTEGGTCCSGLVCAAMTCNENDPSQSPMTNLGLSLCLTAP